MSAVYTARLAVGARRSALLTTTVLPTARKRPPLPSEREIGEAQLAAVLVKRAHRPEHEPHGERGRQGGGVDRHEHHAHNLARLGEVEPHTHLARGMGVGERGRKSAVET